MSEKVFWRMVFGKILTVKQHFVTLTHPTSARHVADRDVTYEDFDKICSKFANLSKNLSIYKNGIFFVASTKILQLLANFQ